MSASPSVVITTSRVLPGALVRVGPLLFFTLAGTEIGGRGVLGFAPRLPARSGSASPSAS